MSQLREQLEAEIQQHNELHQAIEQGEQQLAAMKEERQRRFGRCQLLQELVDNENGEVTENAPEPIGNPENENETAN